MKSVFVYNMSDIIGLVFIIICGLLCFGIIYLYVMICDTIRKFKDKKKEKDEGENDQS